MAYLELKNGKKRGISAQQGLFLWKSLHDPSGLDEAGLDKIAGIKAVYLNWRKAPDAYIQENLKLIIPMALHDWIYTTKGKPLKPGTKAAWDFAKKWGLWDKGAPTSLASGGTFLTQASLTGSAKVYDK